MMPSPRRHLGSSRLQPPLVAIGRAPQVLSALAAMLAGVMHRAAALDNGLGLTSPLGFNSWNHFGCHINESLVLEVADHFESSGMAAAGYNHINLDDCWMQERGAGGKLTANAALFPRGMAWLADQLHTRNLLFGLYMAGSSLNCAPYLGLHTGSLYREDDDAQVLASWRIDSLHYDNCGDNHLDMGARAAAMRDALNRTGREILFMAEPFYADPQPDLPAIMNVADETWVDICSSRTCQNNLKFHPPGTPQPTGLLWPNCSCWYSVLDNIDHNERWNALAEPGFFPGADYLIVGDHVLSPAEIEAHFSLWVISKSPLIHGGDVRSFSPAILAMVNNPELLEIHQDSLGRAGKKVMSYTVTAGVGGGVRGTSASTATGANVSKVLVEPCSTANVSQHWTVTAGGHITAADGRCLTAALSPAWFNKCPGAVLAPCEEEDAGLAARQRWTFDRGIHTISGVVVANASSELPTGHHAMSVVAPVPFGTGGDWKSVALLPYRPESKCSGADCKNASHTATPPQMWYYDQREHGRLQAMSLFGGFPRSRPEAPGRQCLSVSMNEELQVWAVSLADGGTAVLLLNRLETAHDITAHWSALGLPAGATKSVRDVLQRTGMPAATDSLTANVPAHGVRFFKLKAAVAMKSDDLPALDDMDNPSSARKLLFLNKSLVTASNGVRWTMHPPVAAEEPAVRPTEKWETGGLWAVQVIVWAPGDKRLYYGCREYLHSGDPWAPGKIPGKPASVNRICLARSLDGKIWTKEHLGLIEYPPGSGNTSNNIVWPPTNKDGTAASPFGPMSFFKDTAPGVPESEQWKVIGEIDIRSPGQRKSGGVAWATADGLHFHPLASAGPNAATDPVIGVNCSDTENIGVGWLPSARRYAIFVRHDGPDAVGPGNAGPGTGAGRRISVCLTDDLAGSWGNNAASNFSVKQPWCVGLTERCSADKRSCCQVIASMDSLDPFNMVDIYNSAATVYEDHVILFPSFYQHSWTKQHGDPHVAPPWGFGNDGLIDVRLMIGGRLSDPNGHGVLNVGYTPTWNARKPYISQTVNRCEFNGSLDQYHGWCNPVSNELERTTSGTNGGFMGAGYLLSDSQFGEGEEIYLYFGAWPHSHGDLDHPGQNNTALVRYSLRRDGFVSVDGDYAGLSGFGNDTAQQPFLTTVPLPVPSCTGHGQHARLLLNVKTSVVGFVAAELRCDRVVCPGGFGIERATRIKGNFISKSAGWGDPGVVGDFRRDLKELEGKDVAVHLVLPDAEVYSLKFECMSSPSLKSDDSLLHSQAPRKLVGSKDSAIGDMWQEGLKRIGHRMPILWKSDDVLQGSYPFLLKSSEPTLNSDMDINATVAMLKQTKQTVVGMYVDSCRYYSYLRPLLVATVGTGIQVFGTLRSHNGAIYCPAVWNTSAAYGQLVNWTLVATKLATLSLEFPHFIGYTIDDFYCMIEDPFVPPGLLPPTVPPPLSVSTMQAAHTAMKAIAPRFRFMPTVYPAFLGVFAGKTGYTLGVAPDLPFDVNTSAAVTLLPGTTSVTGGDAGSVNFWVASQFSSWGKSASSSVWRGKLFLRGILQLSRGTTNVTLFDVDLFSLTGCDRTEVGAEHVATCVPRLMMQINATISHGLDNWTSLTLELYARDAVNMNVYASKLATIWDVNIMLPNGRRAIIADKVHFSSKDSPAGFTPPGSSASITNMGNVLAHDNERYSIAPACDGLLFPFAENAAMVFTEETYKTVLGKALEATQGLQKALWSTHYGWMYREDLSIEVDPAFLKRMLGWDRAAGVDAIVLFAPRIETGRVASGKGIFAQRQAPPQAIAAAKAEGGWQGVAQAWWPGYTSGCGGWHQTWRSRRPVRGNLTIGVARTGPVAHGSEGQYNASTLPWFFSTLIRIDGTAGAAVTGLGAHGAILYNASAGFSPVIPSEPDVQSPCPGLDVAAAAAAGVRCARHFNSNKLATFKEVVTLTIEPTANLVHIALELAEHRGVGNWDVGAQFALEGGVTEADWHYESGLRDSTELAIWSALLESFAEADAAALGHE